ncbi:aryl-alcohol dehydrogenase-like predicted oxidoreductase [Microbacterium murale]|uniref:Aryl-alcohol dehydrogenase-like predicted oxidoreductase n=1 Tax=Microbacterium murale TaxID=1081040 RepID=A0ABU0PD30_9MICO|nr:aldo/keto reductase [Microbacterium murale]MDQ0645241.1 aryl-alcohol dehydrogenase-like predicted oxidoreductase [Microbacterium murale]
MRPFNAGAVEQQASPQERSLVHPSAPIPVVGPGVGETIRVTLGETGLETFPLMLGAAEFGWNVDLETSHAILDRYIEFGGNAIHTADGFSGGRSEHIIGQWLRSRGHRDRTLLSVRIGSHADNPGLGSVNLVRAVEGSLNRLGVERIDVLYLDATLDQSTNLEDTLATVEWLRDAGKIRAIGAFGFTPERLVEARILAAAGYPRFEVLDEPYNLIRRQTFEGDLRLVAGAQSLAVTPSHALEHGFLSRPAPQQGADVSGRAWRATARTSESPRHPHPSRARPGGDRDRRTRCGCVHRLAARSAHDRRAHRQHVRDAPRRGTHAGCRDLTFAHAGR